MGNPRLWLLAGPNGAGKSTYARAHFPELVAAGSFLNADDLADEVVVYAADARPRPLLRKTAAGMRIHDETIWQAILAVSRQPD